MIYADFIFEGRIVVGTSWFVILIVTSTYTANMAAYFTFSRSLTASEDIESLLKEGVSFSLKKNTALDQFLLQSEYQVYRLLSENIRMKDKYVRNAREGIKAAQADANLLFLGEGPYSEWMINQFACDLKIGTRFHLPLFLIKSLLIYFFLFNYEYHCYLIS